MIGLMLLVLIGHIIGMYAMYHIGFDRGVSAVTKSIDSQLKELTEK